MTLYIKVYTRHNPSVLWQLLIKRTFHLFFDLFYPELWLTLLNLCLKSPVVEPKSS
jgi:hypothetical protein